MKLSTSLRYRVTLAFALAGMVVSLCLAGALYLLTINMEQRLIEETLAAELEDYISRHAVNPQTPPPSSTTIRTYVILPGETSAPEPLRGLETGLHQVRLDSRDYFAEVRVNGERHYVVLYGDEQVRHRQDQFKLFLGIGVLVMTLLSASLGFWLTGRVISPVGELATRVAGLRPREHFWPLAADFPQDEVGILAREFDAYQRRLTEFVEREQSFTADVSHELRTPLAVIEGATEVLLDDPGLDDARRSRLERIARSAREMSELVTALLLLAREEKCGNTESDCVVSEVLNQVVESHRHMTKQKHVGLKLDIQARNTLPVQCTLLRVVLANLFRNALAHSERGTVSVLLDDHGVSIKDTGTGIPGEQIQRIFDRYYSRSTGGEGIGLSLVERICRRYGWRIDIDSHEGRGTIFRLSF
jgi:signal transduction histidine kinase